LFLSENDTLNFRKISELQKDEPDYIFPSNQKGKNYFFKVKASAKSVKPSWSNMVWIQGGVDQDKNLIREITADYYFELGGFDASNNELVYSRNTANYCCEIHSFTSGLDNSTEYPLDSLIKMPGLNADASKLCFASPFDTSAYPEPYNIGLLDRTTNQITRITSGYNNFQYPAWSKDEKHIYFLSENPQVHDAWNIDQVVIASKKISRLVDATQFPVKRSQPSVSPVDGKMAFSVRGNSYPGNIYLYDVGTKIIQRLEQTQWDESNPSFSHSGSHIAFISSRTGHNEIWVMNLQTKEVVQITSSEEGSPDGALIWNGDDTEIIFKGYYQSKYGIFSINLNP
jgi:Tol biopolymer transport system component